MRVVEGWDPDGGPGEGSVRTGAFRCERPSARLAWLVEGGRLVPVRCGSPNKCAYCAFLAAVENAVVVALDGERHGPPGVGMTLTTVDPQHDPGRFRRDVEQVIKAVRRIEPAAQYLGLMEWTTGRGRRSGGHRRMHQHLLVKGMEASPEVEARVRDVWEARTGASRVEVRALRSVAGSIAYLTHHHHKREQAPPSGWSGKRFRPSRGYFGEPVASLREEAARLAGHKAIRRAARRAMAWEQLDGAPEELLDAEWSAALAAARRAAALVCLVRLDDSGAIVGAA